MISNVAGFIWDWCHLSSISRFFEVAFSYVSILGFWMNFSDFQFFVFGYRAQNENTEITETLYFLVYNTPMRVDLCFDHYFNCLSVKTDISKNGLNLIYSEGLKAFKTQIAAAWLAMWLNHFEIDVVWTAFQLFLELHSHISVLWRFCRISVISEFSLLDIGLKTKTQKSRKIFSFGSTKFKWIWIYFSISISTFWVLKLK